MMRVAYDHQTFAMQRHGGISRYFCELAARVHRTAGCSARVIAPLHCNDYLSRCDVPTFGINLHLFHPRLEAAYLAGCRLLAPLPMRATRPALVHRTYYGESRVPPSMPTVLTVFDMIHERLPQEFSSLDPTSDRKRTSVQRADLLLCISQSTADDLMEILQVPQQKIRVTHLGFSDTFTQSRPTAVSPHPRPYLLFVGHRGGYKNFESAVRAYASSARLQQAFDFVAFGGFPIRPEEQALIHSLGLRADAVRRLAGSDTQLANAYRHAHAFIYPSRYEGFGIPPLEAMASGCPVVCSNVSSIPEVVGAAAELFDPSRPEDMAAAVERVCFDEDRRKALVAAGRERLRYFSWDRCAQDTVAAYRLLLGSAGD